MVVVVVVASVRTQAHLLDGHRPLHGLHGSATETPSPAATCRVAAEGACRTANFHRNVM